MPCTYTCTSTNVKVLLVLYLSTFKCTSPHACTHNTHTHTHACTPTHTHPHLHTHARTHTHTHTQHMHVHTPTHTHTHLHRPTHTHAHSHKHTNTHVHTYQEYLSVLEFSTHITKYSLNHFCHYGSKLLCLYSKDNNGHNSTSRNTINLHKAVSVNMMIINTNTLHTIPNTSQHSSVTSSSMGYYGTLYCTTIHT